MTAKLSFKFTLIGLALLLLITSASAAVQCWNGTTGAHVWATFNQTTSATPVLDICGNHNLSTSGTDPTYNIPYTAWEKQFSYDSDNDASLGNNPTPWTSDFSVSMWITPQQLGGGVAHFYASSDGGYWALDGNSSDMLDCMGYDGGAKHAGGTAFSVNSTYHAVCVFDQGVSLSLYVNGSLVKQIAFGTIAVSDAFWVGRAVSPNTFPAYAYIDEVSVYAYALSAAEISNLFTYNQMDVGGGGGSPSPDATNNQAQPANNTCFAAGSIQVGSVPAWNTTKGPNNLRLYVGNANNATNGSALTNNTRYNFTASFGNGTKYWHTSLELNDSSNVNSTAAFARALQVDSAAPAITLTVPNDGSSNQYNAGNTTGITAADAGCGGAGGSLCAKTYYQNGTAAGISYCDYSSPFSIAQAFNNATFHAGAYYLNITANDSVGNWAQSNTTFTITPIATTLTTTVNDLVTYGMNRWVNADYTASTGYTNGTWLGATQYATSLESADNGGARNSTTIVTNSYTLGDIKITWTNIATNLTEKTCAWTLVGDQPVNDGALNATGDYFYFDSNFPYRIVLIQESTCARTAVASMATTGDGLAWTAGNELYASLTNGSVNVYYSNFTQKTQLQGAQACATHLCKLSSNGNELVQVITTNGTAYFYSALASPLTNLRTLYATGFSSQSAAEYDSATGYLYGWNALSSALLNVSSWSLGGTGSVSGAACNATLANGTSFTANATGYANWVEPNTDGELVPVTVQCGAIDYEYKSAVVSYTTDFWHYGKDYANWNTYSDLPSVINEEGDSPYSYMKCSRIEPSVTLDDNTDIRFLTYMRDANATSRVFYLDTKSPYGMYPNNVTYAASCKLTSASAGWNLCDTTVTTPVYNGSTYFVCYVNPGNIGLSDIPDADADGWVSDDAGATFTQLQIEYGLGVIFNSTANTTAVFDEDLYVTGDVKMTNIDGTPNVGAGIAVTYSQVYDNGTLATNYATVSTGGDGRYYIPGYLLIDDLETRLEVESGQTDGVYIYEGSGVVTIDNLTTAWVSANFGEKDIGVRRSSLAFSTLFYLTTNYYTGTLNSLAPDLELKAGNRILYARFDVKNQTSDMSMDDLELTPVLDVSGCTWANAGEWAAYSVEWSGGFYKLMSGGTEHTELVDLTCYKDSHFIITLTNTTYAYSQTFNLTFRAAQMQLEPHGILFGTASENITNYTSIEFKGSVFDAEVQDYKAQLPIDNLTCYASLFNSTGNITGTMSQLMVNGEDPFDDASVNATFTIVPGDYTADNKYAVHVDCTSPGYDALNTTTPLMALNYATLDVYCTVNAGETVKPDASTADTLCLFQTVSNNPAYDALSLASMDVDYEPVASRVPMTYMGASEGLYRWQGTLAYRCGDGTSYCPTNTPTIKRVIVSDVPTGVSYQAYYEYEVEFKDYSTDPSNVYTYGVPNVQKGDKYYAYGIMLFDADDTVLTDVYARLDMNSVYQGKVQCGKPFKSMVINGDNLKAEIDSMTGTQCRGYHDDSEDKYGFVVVSDKIGRAQTTPFVMPDEAVTLTTGFVVKYASSKTHLLNTINTLYSPTGGTWVTDIDKFMAQIAADPFSIVGIATSGGIFTQLIYLLLFAMAIMFVIVILKRR